MKKGDEAGSGGVVDEQFCKELFATLDRSEQRRWARIYVEGLLSVDGKKTICGILGDSPDRFRQGLQQFVNQSPWDPRPVRRAHAAVLASVLRPQAWTVDEVVFVKHGRHSAGVDRQYVPSAGRVSNCQLSLAVSLVDDDAVPVNWRLMLPPAWDRDHERRSRAHVPDHERHRPQWEHVVDAVDEIGDGWGVPSAPIVTGALRPADASRLIGALEDRELGYAVEVSGELPAFLGRTRPRLPWPPGVEIPGPAGHGRPAPLVDIAARALEGGRQSATWRGQDGRLRRAHFITATVHPLPAEDQPARGAAGPPRLLVAEWQFRRETPSSYWLTNLFDRRLGDQVVLMKARSQARESLDRMKRAFGLFDFEGRSFRGWHHHVTLASAAYGYHVLRSRLERMAHRTDELPSGQLMPC